LVLLTAADLITAIVTVDVLVTVPPVADAAPYLLTLKLTVLTPA